MYEADQVIVKLRGSLAPVYKHITKMRHHVIKVYSCNDAGDDLLIFGKIGQTALNGAEMEKDSVRVLCLMILIRAPPRLKFFRGWAVCYPTFLDL